MLNVLQIFTHIYTLKAMKICCLYGPSYISPNKKRIGSSFKILICRSHLTKTYIITHTQPIHINEPRVHSVHIDTFLHPPPACANGRTRTPRTHIRKENIFFRTQIFLEGNIFFIVPPYFLFRYTSWIFYLYTTHIRIDISDQLLFMYVYIGGVNVCGWGDSYSH